MRLGHETRCLKTFISNHQEARPLKTLFTMYCDIKKHNFQPFWEFLFSHKPRYVYKKKKKKKMLYLGIAYHAGSHNYMQNNMTNNYNTEKKQKNKRPIKKRVTTGIKNVYIKGFLFNEGVVFTSR